MPTHVALLRGVNVGGRNKVPMADLRQLVAELGFDEVATYLQSGNVVFTTRLSPTAAAARLEEAVAARLGVSCRIFVLPRAELVAAAEANPFPADDPKRLHLFLRSEPYTKEEQASVQAAQAKSDEKGSRDRTAVIGSTIYLHTPEGIGRSDLAARIGRLKEPGTARNWTTVTKLIDLLDH